MKIPFTDILYIEGSRDHMKIFTSSRQYLVHLTMKKPEEILPASQFIRTHKSYIVSLSKIRAVRNAELLPGDQLVIPASPNYKEQVVKSFQENKPAIL